MVKFLIRVDWLNNRIELSPNIKVLKNDLNNERTVLTMEINYSPNLKECPVYKFATNEMDKEEVFDDDPDSFWWKSNMDNTPDGSASKGGSAASAAVASTQPALASAPSAVSSQSKPASQAMQQTAPSAPSTPKPASAPVSPPPPVQEEAECRPTPDEIAKLKSQLKQIQNIFNNLQQQAAQGKVSEKDFLEKQTFLGEKMGRIMAELDKWHEPYE